MKIVVRGILVCALLAAPASTFAADAIIADLQIVAVGEEMWIVRIRASDAQAFDVLPPARPERVSVRLHGATLAGSLAPVDPAPFGTVRLQRVEGGVEVHVELVHAEYRVDVRQGGSPSTVELRVTRH